MSQVKMKKSEYLVARGWVTRKDRVYGIRWHDPTHFGSPIEDSGGDMSLDNAVVIQQARDAVEMRAA